MTKLSFSFPARHCCQSRFVTNQLPVVVSTLPVLATVRFVLAVVASRYLLLSLGPSMSSRRNGGTKSVRTLLFVPVTSLGLITVVGLYSTPVIVGKSGPWPARGNKGNHLGYTPLVSLLYYNDCFIEFMLTSSLNVTSHSYRLS